MAGAARGSAVGSGEAGDANVGSGHIKWSKTVAPSAVQGIPGVVSENSRPLFVIPHQPLEVAAGLSLHQTDVLTLAAAGCTERETALRLGIAIATVQEHLARVRACLGIRQVVTVMVATGFFDRLLKLPSSALAGRSHLLHHPLHPLHMRMQIPRLRAEIGVPQDRRQRGDVSLVLHQEARRQAMPQSVRGQAELDPRSPRSSSSWCRSCVRTSS